MVCFGDLYETKVAQKIIFIYLAALLGAGNKHDKSLSMKRISQVSYLLKL